MDLSNTGLLRLFNTINADKNYYITSEELKKAEAAHLIDKETKKELENTFTLNKYGLAIDLKSYMVGMNYHRQQLGIQELFTKDELLWSDRTFVLKEVKKNGIMLSRANKVLQNDREIVRAAVESNSNALLYAGPEQKKDPELARIAVEKNGSCWRYIDVSLMNDKNFALLALNNDPSMILDIRNHFPEDQDIWLKTTEGNMNYVELIPQKLLQSDRFLERLAEHVRWPDIVRTDAVRSPLMEKLYTLQRPVIDELCALNIYHPERFKNMKEARAIIAARKDIPTGKTALLTYPEFDDTHAFENNQISELIKKGYTVIYHEVPDENAFYAVIKKEASRHPVSVLVIAGHGRSSSIHLKEYAPTTSKIDEQWYLDLADETELRELDTFLDGTHIVMESCSTGKGKETGDNMVNMFRRALPHAKKIFGPTDDTSVSNYIYSSAGEVIDVLYHKDGTKTIETFGQ